MAAFWEDHYTAKHANLHESLGMLLTRNEALDTLGGCSVIIGMMPDPSIRLFLRLYCPHSYRVGTHLLKDIVEDTATAARDLGRLEMNTDDGGWECRCNVGLELDQLDATRIVVPL